MNRPLLFLRACQLLGIILDTPALYGTKNLSDSSDEDELYFEDMSAYQPVDAISHMTLSHADSPNDELSLLAQFLSTKILMVSYICNISNYV